MIELFWDEKDFGFFFTPKNGENLIVRKKERYDGATPSGQSVAIAGLATLAKLTGKNQYEEYAQKALSSSGDEIRRYPSAYTFLMTALDFIFGPTKELVITQENFSSETQGALTKIHREFLPRTVLLAKTKSQDPSAISSFTASMRLEKKASYYLCQDFSCSAPTQDFEAVFKQLQSR
jgi:uncharacterized protein